MELRDYLRVLLKHWVSILAVTLAGVAVAAVFTYTQPLLYTARAQSFVALSGTDIGGAVQGASYTEQRLASYVSLVSTPDVLGPVAEELGLSSLGQVSAFNPPGTSPPLAGLAVPPDFVLPPGYVRHHQVTDEGVPLEPILMFAPDLVMIDANGRPIPLPDDRVVPPELAPPGLPIRTIEVPVP